MKKAGNWKTEPSDIPEYQLAIALKYAIYAGFAASVTCVISLFLALDVHLSTNFELNITLSGIAGILLIGETIAIVIGIIYFDEKDP
ncbi:hypothetical protein NKF06_06675 [Haloferax sp. AB510]|uniref:hypothetical protein n=1 Tax=Haloferax sp. AB510 TaxID=2934172 RepID=UPI00209C62AD|nr:hypothetical protein [Haloferax sp. AB510]MCO8266276.1 hypothetical protein [Haloferax sp. AB510]